METVPDDVLLRIAACSWACQVYLLCLTTSRFHQPAQVDAGTKIATKLLRAALDAGLRRVLTSHGLSLEAVDFADLRSGGGPAALISGSTMVRAMLGMDWAYGIDRDHRKLKWIGAGIFGELLTTKWIKEQPLDVDIFTTAEAAPAVRTRLVAHGHVLSGMGFTYRDNGGAMLGHLPYAAVHHVEGYAPRPEDGADLLTQRSKFDDRTDFNYEFACKNGESALMDKYCADMDENYEALFQGEYMVFDQLASKGYEIRVLPGTPLPFDWRLRDDETLDLVVAERSVLNALCLLDSFDLNICKASFDGAVFRIPNPHSSLSGRSSIEPARLALMRAFEKFAKSHTGAPCTHAMFADAGVCWPLFENIDWEANRPDDFVESSGRLWYHNFMTRLFHRLRKYVRRGVAIDGLEPHELRSFLKLAKNMELKLLMD